MVERLLIIAAILAVSTLAYVWWSRRQGVVRRIDTRDIVTSNTLGAKRGYRATFVQFSTPMCAKCPPTARLLQRVAADYDNVVHIEIDAAERLDLARRFDIMRTPTILVLDADGRVVARMAGAPSDAQARAALEAAPPPTTEYSI